jgi:hypothetical protein
MCSIPIYFCNIDIQHLQHISETSETLKYTIATCAFSIASAYCLDEWRLFNTELEATKWREVASVELMAAPTSAGTGIGTGGWSTAMRGSACPGAS